LDAAGAEDRFVAVDAWWVAWCVAWCVLDCPASEPVAAVCAALSFMHTRTGSVTVNNPQGKNFRKLAIPIDIAEFVTVST
jgi:hypothetical protein